MTKKFTYEFWGQKQFLKQNAEIFQRQLYIQKGKFEFESND